MHNHQGVYVCFPPPLSHPQQPANKLSRPTIFTLQLPSNQCGFVCNTDIVVHHCHLKITQHPVTASSIEIFCRLSARSRQLCWEQGHLTKTQPITVILMEAGLHFFYVDVQFLRGSSAYLFYNLISCSTSAQRKKKTDRNVSVLTLIYFVPSNIFKISSDFKMTLHQELHFDPSGKINGICSSFWLELN